MALATISGKGFIIADIETKALPSGQFVANFPVAFNKNKKNEQTGEWEPDKSAVIRCTAWGELAEFITEKFQAKTEIELSGELNIREYERNDGSKGQSVEATVRTVSAPIPKRDRGGNSWGKNPASNHDVL
ncbi:putative single-stranded DNA-binding protein [uncultured Caudovirales phage]|uniref:Putative single-stranded DNA-binding protein n=1 Tax=uncultured Caudovirales phage TaxID=2100421 RepID=A0A2H4JA88_9CAUD|nr:putative single-stranded DNA-binding protein [uncultured Caudovirales phage]